MQKLCVSLFLYFIPTTLFAEEFNFLAETEAAEVEDIDPTSLWPNKIILDSASQKIMLVWFDTSPPKNITLPFSDVQTLHSISTDRGLGSELQLETSEGIKYLVGYNYAGTQQQSLLLSALLGINVQGSADQDTRISNTSLKARKEPSIVVGSINDSNALKPTGAIIEDKLLHSSAVGEEIGDAIPMKNTGALSRASVELEIKQNMSRFRGCYQKALGQVPDLQGTVQIQFSVGEEGSVAGARISSSTLKNALAERCILRHMYGIRFKKPSGGTAIFNYPFTFTRRE